MSGIACCFRHHFDDEASDAAELEDVSEDAAESSSAEEDDSLEAARLDELELTSDRDDEPSAPFAADDAADAALSSGRLSNAEEAGLAAAGSDAEAKPLSDETREAWGAAAL